MPSRPNARPAQRPVVDTPDIVDPSTPTALPPAPTTQNTPARAAGWSDANEPPSFPSTTGTRPADAGITDERDIQRAALEAARGDVGDTRFAETLADTAAAPAHDGDARLLDAIHRALVSHAWLDSRDVEVAVDAGVVRLTGTVATRTMRRELEDTCAAVPGVADVLVHVRVAAPVGDGP